MLREWKRVAFLLVALAALASLAAAVNVSASPSAAGAPLAVTMSGVRSGATVTYSIVIANNYPNVIGNIFVAGDVPAGTTFSKVTAVPDAFGFQSVQGTKAVFLGSSIAASSSATISYAVTVTGGEEGAGSGTLGDAAAWVHVLTPVDATASSAPATGVSINDADTPRRGCLACHVAPYTLPKEAVDRAQARGLSHPQIAPDGTSMKPTDLVGPEVCLECHAPGTGGRAGMGNIAPLSLRDIVHPAHMFSTTFKEHYAGQCFTCHNVNANGQFELIGNKMEVNEKGVPNGPTKGLIPPSEGAH
ncbi:MAG: hypothetical protein Q7R39_20195 [Dehalococcoidia bacterium]|nr:hypothetical protein [Dehalococcoidia bacterium]